MLKAIIFDFNRTLYDPDQGRLFDGVAPLLQSFRALGLKQGLVSFGGAEKEKLIRGLGLDKMVESYVVVAEKTPAIFLSFADRFKVRPEETLVVGDLVNQEVALGQSLGMTGVWLKAGKFAGEVPSVQPDFTIAHVAELEPIVKQRLGIGTRE